MQKKNIYIYIFSNIPIILFSCKLLDNFYLSKLLKTIQINSTTVCRAYSTHYVDKLTNLPTFIVIREQNYCD